MTAFKNQGPLRYIGRLSQADIAKVEAILQSPGDAPYRDLDNFLSLAASKWVGREGENNADRDIVHRPR